jgi:hypothetical protein
VGKCGVEGRQFGTVSVVFGCKSGGRREAGGEEGMDNNLKG